MINLGIFDKYLKPRSYMPTSMSLSQKKKMHGLSMGPHCDEQGLHVMNNCDEQGPHCDGQGLHVMNNCDGQGLHVMNNCDEQGPHCDEQGPHCDEQGLHVMNN